MSARSRHLKLFVGLADERPMLGVPSPDVLNDAFFDFPPIVVPRAVQLEPQARRLLDDPPSELPALLPDAAREHERVDRSAERHVVRAHVAADAVGEQVERELVLGLLARRDRREVRRPRQRPPAALLVEDLLRPRDVQLFRGRGRQLADVAGIVKYETKCMSALDLSPCFRS